mmetsp:Transcript_35621/g.82255  ORF Transcript_35621/g.82255 Transcript_35621/m.82255 type:complete len:220 (+) Transcript_35621:856-1515(+)
MRERRCLVPWVCCIHDQGEDSALVCPMIQVHLRRVHSSRFVELPRGSRQASFRTINHEAHGQDRPQRARSDRHISRFKASGPEAAVKAQSRPCGLRDAFGQAPLPKALDLAQVLFEDGVGEVVETLNRQRPKASDLISSRTAQLLCKCAIEACRILLRAVVPTIVKRGALQNGVGKETAASRTQEVELNREGPGGMARQGHQAWVTTEALDVALHPFQG